MNKKFLIIVCIVISFLGFKDNVYAAQELSCLYKKESDAFLNGGETVVLFQSKDGERLIYENKDNISDFSVQSNGWTLFKGNSNFDESSLDSSNNLTACPKSKTKTGLLSKKITFYASESTGNDKLQKSSNTYKIDFIDKHALTVNREEGLLYFKYDDNNQFSLQLFSALCANDECSMLCRDSDGNFHPAARNGYATGRFPDVCDSSYVIEEYYKKKWNKNAEIIYNELKNTNCGSGAQCFSFAKNYCNDWSSNEKICQELKKFEDAGRTDDRGDIYCEKLNVRNCDNKQSVFKVNYEYSKEKDDITFSIDPENNGDIVCSLSNDGSCLVATSTFATKKYEQYNFFEQGSNFNEFKNKLKAKMKANSNNNQCSKPFTMCGYESTDSEVKVKWYVSFSGTCASNVKCQQAIGNVNSGDSDIARETDHSIVDDNQNGGLPQGEKRNYGEGLFTKAETKFTCEDFTGGENGNIANILRLFVSVLRILVPILLLGLGSIDFVKAIFSQDESAMKKAQGHFIKRLVISGVIFLIPSVLTLILSLAHDVWPDVITEEFSTFCGILK